MILSKTLSRSPFCNLYKALGLTPQASEAEIKQKYYELAKKVHPDTGTITSEEFLKIQNAYEILKNPSSRLEYDKEQFPEKYQQYQKDFTYYGQSRENEDPSSGWVISGIEWLIRLGVFIGIAFVVRLYLKPMTQHQIRRQNIILANQNIDDGPAVQQKRRKQYLQEMKVKKFSANVVELKVRDGSAQTTKQKSIKKNSIESIAGISKQPIHAEDNSDKERYM